LESEDDVDSDDDGDDKDDKDDGVNKARASAHFRFFDVANGT
jgi:hypothetical protein